MSYGRQASASIECDPISAAVQFAIDLQQFTIIYCRLHICRCDGDVTGVAAAIGFVGTRGVFVANKSNLEPLKLFPNVLHCKN